MRLPTISGAAIALGLCVAPAAAQCSPQWSALGAGCDWRVEGLAAPRTSAPLGLAGFFDYAGGHHSPMFAGYLPKGIWLPLGAGVSASGGKVALWLADQVPPAIMPGMYVGGDFSTTGGIPIDNLARWDGKNWNSVGGGLTNLPNNSWVASLVLYTPDSAGADSPALYAGGAFTSAGGYPANGFARWDGAKWWAPAQQPGTLNPGLTWPAVYAMTVFDDDGAGPRIPGLYCAGWIDVIGSTPAGHVVRWDGRAWETLGGGLGYHAHALCVFDDDGPGPRAPALFVGGQFSTAGGVPALKIARWDGQSWSAPLGTGLGSTVRALTVWDDDGPGPRDPGLYAAGNFSGGVARWSGIGSGWQVLSGGLSGAVGFPVGYALAAWDEDGPGPNPGGLYVGGHFKFAGGVPANYIARWGCPLTNCYPDCNGDGALNLADFGCFQTNFATGNMQADCNADAQLNLADFGCFQTRFALGCP